MWLGCLDDRYVRVCFARLTVDIRLISLIATVV